LKTIIAISSAGLIAFLLMAAAILVPRMFSEQPRIAFTRGDVSGIYGEIYVMGADGSNPTRLTHNKVVLDREPTFSPDGSEIAFTSDRDGNGEWVCPVCTDCLPLSYSTSSHSSFLVL